MQSNSTSAKAELLAARDPSQAQPTFKQFQDQVDQSVKAGAQARHESHLANLASAELAAKLEAVRLGKTAAVVVPLDSDTSAIDEDVDNVRTLEARLVDPNPASLGALAALLARAIDRNSGELILCLGAHNLQHKSIASIFDSPDYAATPVAPGAVVLLPDTLVKVLDTLTQVTGEIHSAVSILHNPFTEMGTLAPASDAKDPIPLSVNDEDIQKRWSSSTLRILIRRIPEGATDLSEIRVAVVGNVDSGKSTILGVLTKGRLDDGRGRARVALFKHQHEVLTGRTSSVGMELMGFNPEGSQVEALETNGRHLDLTWEKIADRASKLVTFIDLAGHERFLKTTLFGLTSSSPDFVLLIVGANAGLIGMSKEHLSVALALSVPVVCIVTKIDMAPPLVLEATLKQLKKVLRSPGCRKTPVFVKDTGMACELAQSFVAEKACPIFLVSNVTGVGLDLLKTFLNVVPSDPETRYPVGDPLEFSISDVFSVPFTGTVVSGVILSGSVDVGDTVYIGPDTLGAFHTTVIKSIQRKRVTVERGLAGQSVSFALKRIKRSGVRKGMVILAKTEALPKAIRRFEGQVLVLYHNTLIAPRYQAMLHVGSIRQTVQIEAILDKPCIRTGDRATVAFKFIKHAEYIRVGERILFREGKTKGLGIITKLLD